MYVSMCAYIYKVFLQGGVAIAGMVICVHVYKHACMWDCANSRDHVYRVYACIYANMCAYMYGISARDKKHRHTCAYTHSFVYVCV
jgi:hypothetical protein